MEIQFKNVDYIYQADTPFEKKVLHDINFTIEPESYTAIVGHTGSGKSTLIQHLNALKIPTKGSVILDDFEISANKKFDSLKEIREKIGIVFQFPEAQLFEETIGRDIAFGPQNFGVSEEEAMKQAEEILPVVGLDKTFMDRSPFELSGGQMRRVAIAGVLVMEPEVLILDEPTAGLDPQGQREMMDLFKRIHDEKNITIILVTHLMEDVAEYANHMIVLDDGKLVAEGSPSTIFKNEEWLHSVQLDVPRSVSFANKLEKNKKWQFDELPLTLNDLTSKIVKKLKKLDTELQTEKEL
ncbi:MAG: energy-coupling factor ABC transporter ATP-binding protein [Atopostipes sp.]|nr:energy-coupling factor ABC transporter ATP-binding protein [Atopostipes sp.]